MLFIATDARRKFCTQNICANRVRAARHYHRQHQR
jgi:predicted RNA-binding Zn ribbon-like protein